MNDQNPLDKTDEATWSPWAHPNAKLWFRELFEHSYLPLMIEDSVGNSESDTDEDVVRLMLALSVMLGQEGIWPEQRKTVLRTVVNRVTETIGRLRDGPISLDKNRVRSMIQNQMELELEHLRHRIGVSDEQPSETPNWGKFWS